MNLKQTEMVILWEILKHVGVWGNYKTGKDTDTGTEIPEMAMKTR
jgi:hypothetical protein